MKISIVSQTSFPVDPHSSSSPWFCLGLCSDGLFQRPLNRRQGEGLRHRVIASPAHTVFVLRCVAFWVSLEAGEVWREH